MSLALAIAVQLSASRTPLGVFERWGAFRDAGPARCFAIARPLGRGRDTAFASVANWPQTGARNQFHLRLSRARSPRAKVTLAIGERRFGLLAGDSDAWAPDVRTDAAIVSAMRGGRSMSVETLAVNGAPLVDVYPLGGAATAIDAAAVGCVRR